MRAVVIEKPRSFKIKELPDSRPGNGEATLEVRACCVFGSFSSVNMCMIATLRMQR